MAINLEYTRTNIHYRYFCQNRITILLTVGYQINQNRFPLLSKNI